MFPNSETYTALSRLALTFKRLFQKLSFINEKRYLYRLRGVRYLSIIFVVTRRLLFKWWGLLR